MSFQTKNWIFRRLLGGIGSERTKKRLLETACLLVFSVLTLLDICASEHRYMNEENLFPDSQRNFKRVYLRTPSQKIEQQRIIEHQQTQKEYQHAKSVIEGVVCMYREDAKFGYVKCTINTKTYIREVNASYSHNSGIFNLPRVLNNNGGFYSTALDQGIVSHEAGHMILHYLINLGSTSHMRAFHEAFGDLTSHFYRFHNPATRCKFLERLKNGQGCVGDTNFTCTRNNYQPLTLNRVRQNKDLCEVHQLSRTFSSAVYDNMVTAYNNVSWLFRGEIAAENIVTWHKRMLVHAVLSCKKDSYSPTLMDIAQKMLKVSYSDQQYRDGLGQNFIDNGLIVLLYHLPTAYGDEPTYYYSPNQKFLQLCR